MHGTAATFPALSTLGSGHIFGSRKFVGRKINHVMGTFRNAYCGQLHGIRRLNNGCGDRGELQQQTD